MAEQGARGGRIQQTTVQSTSTASMEEYYFPRLHRFLFLPHIYAWRGERGQGRTRGIDSWGLNRPLPRALLQRVLDNIFLHDTAIKRMVGDFGSQADRGGASISSICWVSENGPAVLDDTARRRTVGWRNAWCCGVSTMAVAAMTQWLPGEGTWTFHRTKLVRSLVRLITPWNLLSKVGSVSVSEVHPSCHDWGTMRSRSATREYSESTVDCIL
jgi:hypothetical protein